MNTEKPSLRIRRASPLDAVNLYKLLVDEEIKSGTAVPHDETARIADILTTISTGYVSVVEKSGRIVGSLGFAAGGEPYALSKILDSKWAFLAPALSNTSVPAVMTRRLVEFADKFGAGIRLTAPLGNERIADHLEQHGFVARTQQFYRDPVEVDDRSSAERSDDAALADRLSGRDDGTGDELPQVPDGDGESAAGRSVSEEPGAAAEPVRVESSGSEHRVQKPTARPRKRTG